MKLIQFKSQSAQRVYKDYLQRCQRAISLLSDQDKQDCLLEINSHIYEYVEDHKSNDEMENLLNVLERLGAPEETLKDYVATKKLKQAVKTFNPGNVALALFLNLSNSFIYILLSVLFLFLVCFPVLIILKLISPQNVGLYVGGGNFFVGYVNPPGNTIEVLGNWFIPVALAAMVILYFGIVGILRILQNIKKQTLKGGTPAQQITI